MCTETGNLRIWHLQKAEPNKSTVIRNVFVFTKVDPYASQISSLSLWTLLAIYSRWDESLLLSNFVLFLDVSANGDQLSPLEFANVPFTRSQRQACIILSCALGWFIAHRNPWRTWNAWLWRKSPQRKTSRAIHTRQARKKREQSCFQNSLGHLELRQLVEALIRDYDVWIYKTHPFELIRSDSPNWMSRFSRVHCA
jgi:hypothetical protein